jgi:hypothetical protein
MKFLDSNQVILPKVGVWLGVFGIFVAGSCIGSGLVKGGVLPIVCGAIVLVINCYTILTHLDRMK